MAITRDIVRRCAATLLRLPRLRAMSEAAETAALWNPPPAALLERAYREQLHVIVWLLEDGRTREAIEVACQGPWRRGAAERGRQYDEPLRD